MFLPKLIFSGAVPRDSTKQTERNAKEAWTAAGTAVEGIYHVPISNLCISTNMKYEGGRGLGRTSWIKQQGRTIGEGLGLLRDLDFFLLFYVTFLFCCFVLIPLIPRIDLQIISHNIVI